MITAKAAKQKVQAVTEAAVEQLSHITTTEKIVGAAALGVVVGAAATAIGSSLLHSSDTSAKPANKVTAPEA